MPIVTPTGGSTSDPITIQSRGFRLDVIPHGDTYLVLAPEVARFLGFRDTSRFLDNVLDEDKGFLTVWGKQVRFITEHGFHRSLNQRQTARIKEPFLRKRADRFIAWVYGEASREINRIMANRPQPTVSTPEPEPEPVVETNVVETSKANQVPTNFAEALRLAADEYERAELEKAKRLALEAKREYDEALAAKGGSL